MSVSMQPPNRGTTIGGAISRQPEKDALRDTFEQLHLVSKAKRNDIMKGGVASVHVDGVKPSRSSKKSSKVDGTMLSTDGVKTRTTRVKQKVRLDRAARAARKLERKLKSEGLSSSEEPARENLGTSSEEGLSSLSTSTTPPKEPKTKGFDISDSESGDGELKSEDLAVLSEWSKLSSTSEVSRSHAATSPQPSSSSSPVAETSTTAVAGLPVTKKATKEIKIGDTRVSEGKLNEASKWYLKAMETIKQIPDTFERKNLLEDIQVRADLITKSKSLSTEEKAKIAYSLIAPDKIGKLGCFVEHFLRETSTSLVGSKVSLISYLVTYEIDDPKKIQEAIEMAMSKPVRNVCAKNRMLWETVERDLIAALAKVSNYDQLIIELKSLSKDKNHDTKPLTKYLHNLLKDAIGKNDYKNMDDLIVSTLEVLLKTYTNTSIYNAKSKRDIEKSLGNAMWYNIHQNKNPSSQSKINELINAASKQLNPDANSGFKVGAKTITLVPVEPSSVENV